MPAVVSGPVVLPEEQPAAPPGRPAAQAQRVREAIEDRYVVTATGVEVLPSERVMARNLGVARGTVRAAIQRLERDGLLKTTPGSRTFVVGPRFSKAPALTSFTEDVAARGWTQRTKVLTGIELVADIPTALDLGITAGSAYYRVRRLRFANDVPLSVEDVALPAALVPGLLDHDLTGSLYALLAAVYDVRISRHDRTLSAVNVDAENAQLLDVPLASATLYAVQTAYDQRGRRIELGRLLYRGDRYDFRTTSVVGPPATGSRE